MSDGVCALRAPAQPAASTALFVAEFSSSQVSQPPQVLYMSMGSAAPTRIQLAMLCIPSQRCRQCNAGARSIASWQFGGQSVTDLHSPPVPMRPIRLYPWPIQFDGGVAARHSDTHAVAAPRASSLELNVEVGLVIQLADHWQSCLSNSRASVQLVNADEP